MAGLSLSVLWSESGGKARPGRLDLGDDGLTLHGGSRDAPELREIAFAQIDRVHLARRAEERVAGRAALVLAFPDGGTLSIASLSGAGTLAELAERLLPRVHPRPRPTPTRPSS